MNERETREAIYRQAAEGLREDVSGPRIPYVQQYAMLRDRRRSEGLCRAIDRLVRPGMRVLDLGTGTGILALQAARAGAEVTALELQRAPAALAAALARHHCPGRLELLREEARRYRPARPFDLIICEMIDTWLIRELQVQVMRHALEHCLAPGGQVLPRRALCFVEPVEVDFRVGDFEIPLPHYETADLYPAKGIGERVQAGEFDFAVSGDEEISWQVTMSIFEYGVCNGLRLSMEVQLLDGMLLGGSDWFAPPLVLPVPPLPLAPGGELTAWFRYRCGGGFRDFSWAIPEDGVR